MPDIAICRGCGCVFQTTTEDAGIPDYAAGPLDKICLDCYRANKKGYDVHGRRIQ